MNQAASHIKQAVIWPPAGRYLLAVSGGADSMVLLDLMAGAASDRGYDLIVAHFDHGLRPDSAADRAFVAAAAATQRYGLPFAHRAAHLGRESEAAARHARHAWLETARREHQAAAVVTAHHADDLLETSLLNLARGTGRRGLAPMQAGPILRPLLTVTRADIRAYAAAHHLAWREDPTNAHLANPRNFLRHQLLPHATPAWRARYHQLIEHLATLSAHIDRTLDQVLAAHRTNATTYTFPRSLIRDLSPSELEELLLAAAYRLHPGIELDRRLILEMVMFAKTAPPHSHRPLRQGLKVVITRDHLVVKKP
jgi:tRNA(Ile)-lysidine synthase